MEYNSLSKMPRLIQTNVWGYKSSFETLDAKISFQNIEFQDFLQVTGPQNGGQISSDVGQLFISTHLKDEFGVPKYPVSKDFVCEPKKSKFYWIQHNHFCFNW